MPNCNAFLCEFVLFVLIWNNYRSNCGDFSYEGENGPEHWGEHYPECSGRKQSPVNIETQKVEKKEFPPLEYDEFENDIGKVAAESNSHTLIVNMKNSNKPAIKGGPLNAEYEFIQFHFHWGPNDTVGSEHLIDSKRYSLEMHVVMGLQKNEHSKANVADFAVLAFFGNVYSNSDQDKGLQQVFETLGTGRQLKILFKIFATAITTSGSIKLDNLEHIDSLNNLTTIKRNSYFTYNGSLTTPPCTEGVVWILFEEIMTVDSSMLNLLRHLSNGTTGNLTQTYRPIQPLNNRKIYRGSSTDRLGDVILVAIALFTNPYWHT